ncbi:hypothetical protein D3C71_1595860 [compost metagenome]
MPDRHQHQLIDGESRLDQVAGVHIDAIGAAVDLGHSQIDEVDQHFRQAAFLQVRINGAKGFVTVGGGIGIIKAGSHGGS